MLKIILKYSIPSIISMWFFTLYTMIDGIFVGKYVGAIPLSAINIATPLINFVFALGIMIGVGSSTLMAIKYGANDWTAGDKILSLSLILLLFLGIFFTTIFYLFLDNIIILLGGKGELFSYVKDYLQILVFFSSCFIIGYALEIYIKVDGNTIYPTLSVFAGGITNIILDYLFIVRFDWGIKGASIATGISQVVTTSLLLYYIFFRTKQIKIKKPKFSYLTILKIFKTGFPEFLMEVSTGVSTFIMNILILKTLGNLGISIFSIINYITSFITMSMIGYNQGVQPLISFYFGAKNKENINKIIRYSFYLVSFLGIFSFGIINVFSKEIIGLFLKEINSYEYEKALRIFSVTYLICGLNIFSCGLFTALEKTKLSNLITLIRGALTLGIFLYFLPKINLDFIWLACFFTELLSLICSIYLIKKSYYIM